MLLKHQYNGSLGGGGGNRLGPATITFGGISGNIAPLVGEMMVLTIEAQYGVFGIQNQPAWSVSDDAGNVWVNVGNTFLDGIIVGFGDPTGAYLGAFDLSTWVCFAHNGSAITGITFTQSNVMTNGWDCQGGASLSIWDTSGYAATYYSKTFGNTALTSPALDPLTPPAGTELIIASFSAGKVVGGSIEGGTYQPGWTGPLTTGLFLYVDDYKIAPTGSLTPTYTSPISASYWLASAVAITGIPVTLLFTAQQGGPSPVDQNVSLVATGAWTIASDEPWLTSTSSGTGNASIDVHADSTLLAAGVYTGHLTVTPPGSPATIIVNLVVTPSEVSNPTSTVPYDYLDQDIVASTLIEPRDNDSFYNPVFNNHTGFAADGTRYTNGVQDPGPNFASWYVEPFGDYRGSTQVFPSFGLVLVSKVALTILDESNANANPPLPLWMLFLLADQTALTNNWDGAIQSFTPSSVCYADGVVSVTYTPDIGNQPSGPGVDPPATNTNIVVTIDFSQDLVYLDVGI